MIRKTSIEAYNTIKENGLLGKRQWQVYEILFEYGPLTGGEVFKYMKLKYGLDVPTNSNTTTRLGELRAMGSAEEIGERECSVSGQLVNLWDVTDRLPIRRNKKTTKIKCEHCNGRGFLEQYRII